MSHFNPIVKISTNEDLISVIFDDNFIEYSEKNLISSIILVLMSLQMAVDELKILAEDIDKDANTAFVAQHVTGSCLENLLLLAGETAPKLLLDEERSMEGIHGEGISQNVLNSGIR